MVVIWKPPAGSAATAMRGRGWLVTTAGEEDVRACACGCYLGQLESKESLKPAAWVGPARSLRLDPELLTLSPATAATAASCTAIRKCAAAGALICDLSLS